jgi:hypothetical protein
LGVTCSSTQITVWSCTAAASTERAVTVVVPNVEYTEAPTVNGKGGVADGDVGVVPHVEDVRVGAGVAPQDPAPPQDPSW